MQAINYNGSTRRTEGISNEVGNPHAWPLSMTKAPAIIDANETGAAMGVTIDTGTHALFHNLRIGARPDTRGLSLLGQHLDDHPLQPRGTCRFQLCQGRELRG